PPRRPAAGAHGDRRGPEPAQSPLRLPLPHPLPLRDAHLLRSRAQAPAPRQPPRRLPPVLRDWGVFHRDSNTGSDPVGATISISLIYCAPCSRHVACPVFEDRSVVTAC